MRNTKNPGAALALEFAAECIRRGGVVSEPYGDNARYDLLLDNGTGIFRVQIKSASHKGNGVYTFNSSRKVPSSIPGKSSVSVPYKQGEVDLIVTRAGHAWYLFRNPHTFPGNTTVYPSGTSKKGKYEYGKEAWEIVGLSSSPSETRARLAIRVRHRIKESVALTRHSTRTINKLRLLIAC